MEFSDIYKDKLFDIDTEGRSEKYSDDDIYPYEPTPYSVLERLLECTIIDENDHVIDFGSGMGRACLYLAEKTGCKCSGVEIVNEFYGASIKNLTGKKLNVEFVQCPVEEYVLPDDANVMYYFNPFSKEIFERVISNIIDSYHRNTREIKILIYYPSDEYVAYLMRVEEITFFDEIDCTDLFEEETRRNRIMVFEVL